MTAAGLRFSTWMNEYQTGCDHGVIIFQLASASTALPGHAGGMLDAHSVRTGMRPFTSTQLTGPNSVHAVTTAGTLLNFSAPNDLGLADRPIVVAAAREAWIASDRVRERDRPFRAVACCTRNSNRRCAGVFESRRPW
jgi:hypothetical protein